MRKSSVDYGPIRILSFDFFDIVFHDMLNLPMETPEDLLDYSGSIPTSLDSIHMGEELDDFDWDSLCGLSDDDKNTLKKCLKPNRFNTRDSLRRSNAVINAFFSDSLNLLSVVIKDGELALTHDLPKGDANKKYEFLRDKYSTFKKEYQLNRSIYPNICRRINELEEQRWMENRTKRRHIVNLLDCFSREDISIEELLSLAGGLSSGDLEDKEKKDIKEWLRKYCEKEEEREALKKYISRIHKAAKKHSMFSRDSISDYDFKVFYYQELKLFRSKAATRCKDAYKRLLTSYFVYLGNVSNSTIKNARELTYQFGFKLKIPSCSSIQKYVVYKRSGNKAKKGSCLFIWEPLSEKMMDWTWMDLPYNHIGEEEGDLTSAKAYEALVQSEIIRKVDIDPDSILMIDSVESDNISANQLILTKTGDDQYELLNPNEYKETTGEEFIHKNIVWDGQALLDKSIFTANEENDSRSHGMMLIRNHFFKACAFNANISDYYESIGVTEVTDKYGNVLPASGVKMIVTPDSLKFLKFASVFSSEIATYLGEEESSDKEILEKRAFEYWKKHISSGFGIVKDDKTIGTSHGKYHQFSYQALNTLPLSKEEIKKLLTEDLRYIDLLRNNDAVLMHHIKGLALSVQKTGFIYYLYKHYPNFSETDMFRNFRNMEIQEYKRRLREGRVKVQGDFYYLCSMPMEMLEYSVHRDRERIKPYLSGDQAYIEANDKDSLQEGEQITLFRYPHMYSSAVCVLKNHQCKELAKWFNLRNEDGCNIIVVSPWNSNIMVKLGGADFDSDQAFFVKDKIIQDAANRLMSIEALSPGLDGLPVAQADDRLKRSIDDELLSYSYGGMAQLDYDLSRTSTSIGSISNDAQLFTSYFWEGYFSDKDDDHLRIIYDCISKLAVINELEIDRSKHKIEMDTNAFRKKIRQTEDGAGEQILKGYHISKDRISYYYPNFLYDNKKKNNPSVNGLIRSDNRFWDCPMDYVGLLLEEEKQKHKTGSHGKRKEYTDFLNSVLKKMDGKPNDKQSILIEEIVKAATMLVDLDRQRTDYDDTERAKEQKAIQDNCINEICSKKITKNTLIWMIRMAFERYESDSKKGAKSPHKKGDYKHPEIAGDYRIRHKYLGLLFESSRQMTVNINGKEENLLRSCLVSPDIVRKTLAGPVDRQESAEDQIELWGEWYDIVDCIDEDKYIELVKSKNSENS